MTSGMNPCQKYLYQDLWQWVDSFEVYWPAIVASWKYDGIAVELIYEKGKLRQAITRGDGEFGEDITNHVLKMQNVMEFLPDESNFSIKAEIVMLRTDFERYLEETIDKDPYDNPRNGASGAARSGRNCEYCSLRYYGLIEHGKRDFGDFDEFAADNDVFGRLSSYGFDGVEWWTICSKEKLVSKYNEMLEAREEIDFDVDGIILSVDDPSLKDLVQFDSRRRPKFRVAFKFPSRQAHTVLKDIEWNVGKNGHITPVAIIDPVDLGVTVERASLANLNKMREKKISIGDTIVVSRRGDVIPHVEYSVDANNRENYFLPYPTNCPSCFAPTTIDGAFLMCPDEECDAKLLGLFEHWIETMKDHFKIMCIGPERLKELFNKGMLRELGDLYSLTVSDICQNLERTGVKSAENMLRFQSYTDIPLHIFLGGLKIKDIGSSLWENLILNGGNNFDTLEKIVQSTRDDIENACIEGLGPSRIKLMVDGLEARQTHIDSLLEMQVRPVTRSFTITQSAVTGKSFCITGALSMPRYLVEGEIKNHGGIIKSGVSKRLDYLIVGEKPGSKLDKAQNCGTSIIDENRLKQMMEEECEHL
jgi:DNA ligase (NAD+)